MLGFRLGVWIDRLIDGLPAEPQRNAPDDPELRRGAAWNWNRHGDDGLAIFVVGHHSGQIGAANQREQPFFVLAQARQPDFKVVEDIDVGHDGMVRHAFQSLVAEVARHAAADHRRGDFQIGESTQARQRGDDRRRVGDLIFSQVSRLRAWIGDQFLAVAVI